VSWSPTSVQVPCRAPLKKARFMKITGITTELDHVTIDRARRLAGAPPGRPGWAQFLRSEARAKLAPDFFTADLLNGTKADVLAVIKRGTRRIRILGATQR
jgi:hypothetical protein